MNRRGWTLFVIAVAMMAGTAAVLSYWQTHQRLGRPGVKLSAQPPLDEKGRPVGSSGVALPEQVGDAASEPAPIQEVEVEMLPKDTTFGRRLYKWPDGQLLLVSVVLMGRDRTSIHKPQYCLTGQGWRIEKSEQVTLPMERPHPWKLPAMKIMASKTLSQGGATIEKRGIYVYWFVTDGAVTAEHGERMWRSMLHLLRTGELQRWGYISAFATCDPGREEETFKRMEKFLIEAVPEFQTVTADVMK